MKHAYILFLILSYLPYSYPCEYQNIILQANAYIHKQENNYEEGFLAETKIRTLDGYRSIEDLKEHDIIVAYDPIEGCKTQRIENISKKNISEYVTILIGNEIIYAAPNQKFYLPQEKAWIDAKDIKISHLLLTGTTEYFPVEQVEKICGIVDAYAITVDSHNFYITQSDILAHNADVVCKYALGILNIGRVALKNPIAEIIGYSIALASSYLLKNQMPTEKNQQPAAPINGLTPERMRYEKLRSELYNLRNDFLKIKEEFEQFLKRYQHLLASNFTNTLLLPIKPGEFADSAMAIRPAQELQYNDQQKECLRKVRQAELDQLEQQILELQIALAFQFNELINTRNQALNDFNDLKSVYNKDGSIWNMNGQNISDNAVISFYEKINLHEDHVQNIEAKNQELKFTIQYYQNIQKSSAIKRTTNIDELLIKEEKEIFSIERLISEQKNINIKNKKIIEQILLNRKINISTLSNNFKIKIKKMRESKLAKELADAAVRRASIKPPQKPKKDDDENNEIKICEKSAAHMFRQKEGHLVDTPANRKLLTDLVSNQENFLGADKFGNKWYGRTLTNKQQLWAQVRNNLIRNGGLNKVAKSYNPESGLCQLIPPGK